MKLAKERGVNHTLIDAQVRLELVPKKYKAEHQAYLDAVTNGKKGVRPVVYEQPPQQAVSEPQKEGTATTEATVTATTSEASGTKEEATRKPTAKNNVTAIRTKKPQPRKQPSRGKQPATQKQMRKTA
ncbi:MAG: hypothetical protein H0W76_07885 [Pyrinomonadaceae bacterium]|nr:hypothetical protein [Pyrinomonadaceae bacterium]